MATPEPRPEFPLMSEWLRMKRPQRVRLARKLLLDACAYDVAGDTFSERVLRALQLTNDIDLMPAGSEEAAAFLSAAKP